MSSVDLAHTPAATPPPGLVSNLENPMMRDQSPGVVLAIFGMSIATTFLAMRIYTKAFLAHLFGIDDVFLLLSWVMCSLSALAMSLMES